MQVLKISRILCSGCLECHTWYPELLFKFVDNELVVENKEVNRARAAIRNCPSLALTMKELQ